MERQAKFIKMHYKELYFPNEDKRQAAISLRNNRIVETNARKQ